MKVAIGVLVGLVAGFMAGALVSVAGYNAEREEYDASWGEA